MASNCEAGAGGATKIKIGKKAVYRQRINNELSSVNFNFCTGRRVHVQDTELLPLNWTGLD